MTRSIVPLALLSAVLLAACRSSAPAVDSSSTTASNPLPEASFDGRALEAQLRFLAADELLGRQTGEPGADVAARFIAEHFRAAGLRTVPGADGYFQPVPFVTTAPPHQASLALFGQSGGYRRTRVTSNNILGWVEGRDPARRDEFVVLMAHYDHIGAGMTNGPGATPADSIFNGARDNGMGVVAVMNAAYALAAAPPDRSVLFLAVTGEENGLLGSRYYVEHPLLPLDQMVYVLNVDGGGYSDTSVVTVIGLERTTAASLIQQGAAAFGLTAIADPAPEQNLFDRSDNVNFAAKGIPAPTFSPGFRSFSDPGVANYYHRPTDEADDTFDFTYLLRFTQAYTRTARLIANAAKRPTWIEGDKYEAAAKALYETK